MMYFVIIAAIIIIPIAYCTTSQWMSNFAYKTEINYMVFGVTGVLALLFAFITVTFHSLKTARMNPVNSLRSE